MFISFIYTFSQLSPTIPMNVDAISKLTTVNYIFNPNFPPRSGLMSNCPFEIYTDCLLGISNSLVVVPNMLSDPPAHSRHSHPYFNQGCHLHLVTSREPMSHLFWHHLLLPSLPSTHQCLGASKTTYSSPLPPPWSKAHLSCLDFSLTASSIFIFTLSTYFPRKPQKM